LVADGEQPVIWDHDERVHFLPQRLDPLVRLLPAARAFECERPRDDGHRQRSEVLGHSGYDGRGPRATAHACVMNTMSVPSAHPSAPRVTPAARGPCRGPADAEASRQTVTDADPGIGLAACQGLRVRVDADEVDAPDTGGDHSVDGVAAPAADADYFDGREAVQIVSCCHSAISFPLLSRCPLSPVVGQA
jgi:hypothetical protein